MRLWSNLILNVHCIWIHLDRRKVEQSKKKKKILNQEWMQTQADALHKLCLSSALRVFQIFNTALQDLKKICRIRGCKPGQLDILIRLSLRAAFNFPTIRCTWRLIWCFVNLLCCLKLTLSVCVCVSLFLFYSTLHMLVPLCLSVWVTSLAGHYLYLFHRGHLVISNGMISMY